MFNHRDQCVEFWALWPFSLRPFEGISREWRMYEYFRTKLWYPRVERMRNIEGYLWKTCQKALTHASYADNLVLILRNRRINFENDDKSFERFSVECEPVECGPVCIGLFVQFIHSIHSKDYRAIMNSLYQSMTKIASLGKVWKIYSEKHVYQSLNDWYTDSTIQNTLGYSVSEYHWYTGCYKMRVTLRYSDYEYYMNTKPVRVFNDIQTVNTTLNTNESEYSEYYWIFAETNGILGPEYPWIFWISRSVLNLKLMNLCF